MKRVVTLTLATLLVTVMMQTKQASAQITAPRTSYVKTDRFVRLDEQLTNRLRATTREQQGYIDYVVKQVKNDRLDIQLVVAMERYALQRRPNYPFPYFERAMKLQAAKRGIVMPPAKQFANLRIKIDL